MGFLKRCWEALKTDIVWTFGSPGRAASRHDRRGTGTQIIYERKTDRFFVNDNSGVSWTWGLLWSEWEPDGNGERYTCCADREWTRYCWESVIGHGLARIACVSVAASPIDTPETLKLKLSAARAEVDNAYEASHSEQKRLHDIATAEMVGARKRRSNMQVLLDAALAQKGGV